MSRIGKIPVQVPPGVEVILTAQAITVRGPLGELTQALHPDVLVTLTSDSAEAVPGDSTQKQVQILCALQASDALQSVNTALVGTFRQLIHNMATGVHSGFEKKLQLVGTGYKASAQGTKLTLHVGFSHPVDMEMPTGITVATPTPTDILIKGANRQKVGQIAAEIRAVRPPEPYKGKGIRYLNEEVVIKEVKKK